MSSAQRTSQCASEGENESDVLSDTSGPLSPDATTFSDAGRPTTQVASTAAIDQAPGQANPPPVAPILAWSALTDLAAPSLPLDDSSGSDGETGPVRPFAFANHSSHQAHEPVTQ